MSNLFSFILSVIAGIYSYYICKWLDGKKQSAKSLKKDPPVLAVREGCFLRCRFWAISSVSMLLQHIIIKMSTPHKKCEGSTVKSSRQEHSTKKTPSYWHTGGSISEVTGIPENLFNFNIIIAQYFNFVNTLHKKLPFRLWLLMFIFLDSSSK